MGTATIPAIKVYIRLTLGSGWLSSLSQNQSHNKEGDEPARYGKNKVDAVKFWAIFQL